MVTELLCRTKYIGVWMWGQNRSVRDLETGTIRQELRSEDETRQWIRHLPELQIVDPETFAKAQKLLDENEQTFRHYRETNGRFRGSRPRGEAGCLRHLLSGLIVCGGCRSRYVVGGAGAKYMFCPAYKRGTCSQKSQLNRPLAERLILEAIGRCILDSSEWTRAVLDSSRRAWLERNTDIPVELASLRQQIADLDRQCTRLVDQVEISGIVPDFAERVWYLWTEGESFRCIGRSCGVTDTTVKKAVEYWCRQKSLSLPNVDTRRQRWTDQALELISDGMSLQEVAQRLGKCVPTVRKWLNDLHGARIMSQYI